MDPLATAGARPADGEFPYELLLAYQRGELDPLEQAQVEELLRTEPRWDKHYRSIEFLDLERVAALQDSTDLQQFRPPGDPTERRFCLAVARTQGAVFEPLLRGEAAAEGFSRGDWTAHCQRCVYCRRMRRQAHAREIQATLPAGEPLLREWLLEPYYAAALVAAGATVATLAVQVVPATPSTLMTPASSVGSVLLWLVEGLFQTIQATGWESRMVHPRSSPSEVAAVLSDSGTEASLSAVELKRQLAGGRGRLLLCFRVLVETVALDVQLTRTDPEPLVEITLLIEIQGQPVLNATSQERTWKRTVELPGPAAIAGLSVHLRIARGVEVWEESSFQFQV